MKEYKTVQGAAYAEFIQKKSKFLAYLVPVKTQVEAINFINDIKLKHKDARHNVYAYILKEENRKKYFEDGEPQGTAGKPILEVLEKNNLYDVVLVVSRYFGGILLGAGGLLRAYSSVASLALKNANIIKSKPMTEFSFYCNYKQFPAINHIIKNLNAKIISIKYLAKIEIFLLLPKESEKEFKEKLICMGLDSTF